MTKKEEKEVIRVHGESYDYEDIPSYIRNRDEQNCSEENPIGGTIERHDIETEKEMCDRAAEEAAREEQL